MPKLTYPTTERGPQVDDYHGTQVADPYRWLEDLDAESVRAWVTAQNQVSRPLPRLAAGAGRDREAADRALELRAPRRPRQAGRAASSGLHNDGLQNQDVLMVADAAVGEPRVLLDPNTLERGRQGGARRPRGESTTGGSPPTRARRAAPTGATGGCWTSRPEATSPTTSPSPSSPRCRGSPTAAASTTAAIRSGRRQGRRQQGGVGLVPRAGHRPAGRPRGVRGARPPSAQIRTATSPTTAAGW